MPWPRHSRDGPRRRISVTWRGPGQVMDTREFADGDVVVREGDMGDEFFIIQKGTCHVYKLLPDRPTI